MSPIIVDRGNSEFKFIEDGRAKDASANYTYVPADEWPRGLAYMLERDYDTTPQGRAGGGGGGGGSGRSRGDSTQATPPSTKRGPQGAANTSRSLVELAMPGRDSTDNIMTAQEIGPVSPGIPPVENPWLQYTSPEEATPAGLTTGNRPQAQFGAEPVVSPLPIDRPTTGDLLQQRYGSYDPTAGQKYPYGSPLYNRSWTGDIVPPISFANNQPQFAPPAQTVQPTGGYDFSDVNALLQGLQDGTIVLPGWR